MPSPDTVPGDLADIKATLHSHEHRLNGIESAIRENTQITADIRDGMVMMKTIRKLVVWLTPLVIAGAAAWHYLEGHLGRGR